MRNRAMKYRVWLLLSVAAMLVVIVAGSALAYNDGGITNARHVADSPPVSVSVADVVGDEAVVVDFAAQPKPTRVPSQVNGLPTITLDRLPREALVTLILILRDGPYPYDKDGAIFQNREGLLPRKSNGYYREYTVITPGESDRGARRIIAGERDEFYYTDDHYDSFKWIYLP